MLIMDPGTIYLATSSSPIPFTCGARRKRTTTHHLQNEHRGGRAEHRERDGSDCDSRQPRAGLALHQFVIGCGNQNSDEQKWREDAIDHRCPKEGLDWINFEKI